MKIYIYKEKSDVFEKLILSMNRKKFDKITSNIENFCSKNIKNDKIVKISDKDIYFYRIDYRTRLIFSKVEDNIILYDVYYTDTDIDIPFTIKDLNNLFPVILFIEFLFFIISNFNIFIAIIGLTMLAWTIVYTKSEKNGQNT